MCEIIKTLPELLQWGLILIPILSLAVAAIALVKNLNQTKLNNRIRRATIVSDWLLMFVKDEMMHRAFYKIEYGKFKYSDKFHDSNEEVEIDKLLQHCSNLAILWENGAINLSDIGPIKYFIKRAVKNSEIKNYLDALDEMINWTDGHPYVCLNKLCEEL